VADGHQGVLKPVALRDVVVDVVGGHHPHAQPGGQLRQPPIAPPVALDQVLLELHEDVGGPEPVQVLAQQRLGRIALPIQDQAGELSLPTAGEQQQPCRVLRQKLGVQDGVPAVAGGVGAGDEPAQVGVALRGLDQRGQVGAVPAVLTLECDFCPDDGLHPQAAGGLGKGHGPAQVVVVGEGQGRVAQLLGPRQQLLH
jgi:hypothetical protein